MYKAVFNSTDSSDYYHNDKLLFSVRRKRLMLGFRSINNVFDNNKLILSFYTSEFTSLYWKVRILSQSLGKRIEIEKENRAYVLIVDNKKISIKFTKNPFKKKIGLIYIDEINVGNIERRSENSKDCFIFNFIDNSTLEFYILILFSIYSVGITDNA